jgi:PAS domain S-box-containing protein
MKKSGIDKEEILPLLDHHEIPWIILAASNRVNPGSDNMVIKGINQRFLTLLGLKQANLLNKQVQKLILKSKSEIHKKFYKYIISPAKSNFSLFTANQDYTIKKHQLLKGILITAQEKHNKKKDLGYLFIEKKFRSIFNAMGDFVFITAFNGKFLEVNDTALQILAYSRKNFLKLTPRDVSVSKDLETKQLPSSAFEEYDDWAQSEQLLFGAELLTKDGKKIPIEARSKIIDYDGSEAILTIARDITERAMFEKRLLNIVMETEEKERRRLAEELHDGLGPLLSSVKMHIDMLVNDNLDIQKKDEVARLIKELVAESINNIREISSNLMPHILSNYGLVSALKTLISKITTLQSIKVKFEHSKWSLRPEKSIEVLIYRVISELLTNTLKHASASNINICLTSHSDILHIEYSDDGIGFDSGQKFTYTTGMGLTNIFNRIKSQQGVIILKTAPGKGLHIHLQLPLES